MNKFKLATLFILIAGNAMAVDDLKIEEMRKKLVIPKEITAKFIDQQRELKSKGYIEEDSQYSRYLLSIQAPQFGSSNIVGGRVEEDTNMKPYLKDIKVAFQVTVPKIIENKNIIGFAPMGSFIREKNGWSGYKIFFNMQDNTVCSYSFMDLNLSGGKIFHDEDDKKYTINSKPGLQDVRGSYNSGFMYSVHWYGDNTMNMLECAQTGFNKDKIELVKSIAIKIDSNTL